MADNEKANLVSKIPDEKQKEIAIQVIQDYDTDILGRAEWEEKRERWYKLWACVRDEKSTPWPGASNVCIPMLSTASNQFHARAYQSIFAPPGMVKVIPIGQQDYKRAKNVEMFLNWQTMYEMEEYEEVFDKVLQLLPVNGTAFKKFYFDFDLKRPVSAYISPLDLVLPYRTKDLATARRITHRLWLHYDELQDRDELNLYENFDKVQEVPGELSSAGTLRDTGDDITGEDNQSPTESPHLILERHSKRDLGDGRKPYIITVDYDSQTLLRMTSREVDGETLNYFVDYHFIPNSEGFYSFGFGHFLEPLNEMANTAFNQIFDAGRLSNQPFGFYGRRAGIKKREIKLHPGQMIEVEDAGQVFFPSMQRVDMVLFQVLNNITQYSEQFTSTSDYLSGRESKGTKTPTASGTLAIIEQGLVTFGVMTKRIFRSLRKELRLIKELNQLYMPDSKEYRLMENEENIPFPDVKRKDFKSVSDVIPVGDPSYASKLTRRAEAMELYQTLMTNPLIVGNPELQMQPNLKAIHELTSDLIDGYDKKNKNKILPDLPEQPLSPEEENALFMQGDTVMPKAGEDHQEHIGVHQTFMQGEFFRMMPEDFKRLMGKHLTDTIIQAQTDMVMQQQLGGQPQQGGKVIPMPGMDGQPSDPLRIRR